MSDRENEPTADDAEAAAEPVEPEAVTEESESDEADDETDDETGDRDDDEAGDDAGEPEPGKAGVRRISRRWVAVAVLVLGLAVVGYESWLLFAHHQREVAAAQALDAAEKYTLVLTGVDPGTIDQNFADVLDGATGEFKDMYSASSEQLRQLLIENKATAHGTVIESAVKSASKNKVEVVLFVDQSVSNKAAPQPKIDRSRIVMTMEKVGGRWLAAKVDMP